MPTYEYECDKCRRVFEIRQRISEPALTTCDECGGAVRRLLSPAPFILKGDGWYVTDYPSAARKKGMEADKKPSIAGSTGDKAESKSESKGTESKTETKTESKPATTTPSTSGSSTSSSSST